MPLYKKNYRKPNNKGIWRTACVLNVGNPVIWPEIIDKREIDPKQRLITVGGI
jgi:intein/homing endonuclease